MRLFDLLAPWITIHLSPRFRWRARVRGKLAARYIEGRGVELGALIMPVRLPKHASVHYLDAWSSEQLRRRYPQYGWLHMAVVDVVAEGQSVSALADSSLDFLVANHLIEHCPNPLRTIEAWLGALRAGGTLFMAVPDKRRTFDRDRPLTSVEHVLRDYREGPAWSEQDHWEEYVRLALNVPTRRVQAVMEREKELDHRPHYHVWTAASFGEMLAVARTELGLPFDLEEIRSVAIEFIAVLRKA